MFIIRIWNYFRGYAIIIVEGLKIERFINLAVVNGIYIWDIRRKNYTAIEAKIGLEHFAKLREIVKKTDSSISIVSKCGFPFFLKNVKRKKYLYGGLLLLLIFIFMISSRVWMIEIVGNKSVEQKLILENLSKAGLKEGVSINKIDKQALENKMLIYMPEFSWLGIQIKGTKAIVTVTERRAEPVIINKDEACDIIAERSGVVSKLLVLNGDAVVKDGNTVKKGQVLVTGTIIRENIEPRYVHSMAQVTARTWYEEAEEIALTQIEYKETGRTDTQRILKVLNWEATKKKQPIFKDYNEFIEEKNIFCFGDYVFPVKLITIKQVELNAITKNVTVEEAKKRCEERLNAKIMLELPENAVILNKKIENIVDKKTVKAKISVEVLEEIGVEQKIEHQEETELE